MLNICRLPRKRALVQISLFDFDLPEGRIALRPAEPRDSARMLVIKPDEALQDAQVRALPDYFRSGDVLVINNTRVIPTQLFGKRSAAKIGVTLIKRVSDGQWWGFAKNAKRLALQETVDFPGGLTAQVLQKNTDGQILFQFDNFTSPFERCLEHIGQMPLPPYIAGRRAADAQDRQDYQTAFAAHDGSVAAPTAGLHFTSGLLQALADKGVARVDVTLHVGAGTFLPVKAEDTRDHVMHAEWGSVSAEAAEKINAARQRGGRIICVGTTSLRLLESAADAHGQVHAFTGDTDIFITPGYRFKVADMLLTNFHLPKSTLFMLVSALAGRERMLAAYHHAIAQEYRFYSYGDASLIYRHDG